MITFEEVMERLLNRVPNTVDKREGSIIYDALAPSAVEIVNMHVETEEIYKQTFADTADRDYLILRAKERGITPYEATKAVVLGEFTPTKLEIKNGARFSIDDLNYIVVGRIADGQYRLECETSGTVGNTKIGTIIPIDYIDGLATATITEVLVPGEDDEDTEVFRARYLEPITDVAFGGNANDYKQKVNAMQGVGGVKVVRGTEWNGGGTVKLVIISSDYGVPTQTVIDNVQNELDPLDNQGTGSGLAPIGHIVTVVGANAETVNITVDITYGTGYSWDNMQTAIESAVDEYLLELCRTWDDETNLIVRIAQIENHILNLEGVIDVANTMINGQPYNLSIGKENVPTRGTING